jgi:hypothetical protein
MWILSGYSQETSPSTYKSVSSQMQGGVNASTGPDKQQGKLTLARSMTLRSKEFWTMQISSKRKHQVDDLSGEDHTSIEFFIDNIGKMNDRRFDYVARISFDL